MSPKDQGPSDRGPRDRVTGNRAPRVVAELGRPETPQETADRKAEASRKRRANQTVFNLVLALAASLAIVVLLVLVVVRPDQAPRDPVDYAGIARESQLEVEVPLVVPVLPEGWQANNAVLDRESGDTATWRIGFVTPENRFAALDQGIGTDDGWLSERVQSQAVTSTTEIGGLEWEVYDRRDDDPTGNYAYSLVTTVDGVIYLVHGVATDTEFITLAASVAAEVEVDR
ncbi:MAG: hypothetical protein RI885_872 [Actinomycetota bacterium]|jgi:hypothetical protein